MDARVKPAHDMRDWREFYVPRYLIVTVIFFDTTGGSNG
jgi:hypothetical protein